MGRLSIVEVGRQQSAVTQTGQRAAARTLWEDVVRDEVPRRAGTETGA